MVAAKLELARFFFLGYLNLIGFLRKDPATSVGRALSNGTVLDTTAHISADFSYFASYEKGNVERLLVDGYAILLEEMKFGDPEKILTGEKLSYIKRLAKRITTAMRPEGTPRNREDPTEEIY